MPIKRNLTNVMTIDPTLEYERMMSYKEKHSMWFLFETLYWGIYLLSEGVMLLKGVSLAMFFGWSFVIGAIFVIVYGISMTLHLKLMKRYA
jgi:hypothetical protein